MKKAVAVLGIGTVLAAVVGAVPRAVESATPVSETIKVSIRDYNECVVGTGELTYLGQHEITSSLPLVIEKLLVREGDIVEVGDTVATIDSCLLYTSPSPRDQRYQRVFRLVLEK